MIRKLVGSSAHPWTVAAFAARANLFRSAFVARFVEVVGQTPQRYRASWRPDLASDQLRSGTLAISDRVLAVGYGSEAAQTRVLKALFATTPAAFRRSGRPNAIFSFVYAFAQAC